jgi:gliding motility-associated-like protein/uncharacterized repeat protein (TIGR01451 family)
VTNPGNVSLHNVALADPHPGLSAIALQSGDANADTILNVNEIWVYTATYSVTQTDIDNGTITNQAIVRGITPDDKEVTDQSGNSATDNNPNVIPICSNPAIAIVKTGLFEDTNENGFAQVGEKINYTFTVTNTGNVLVTNITISDPLAGLILTGNPIASLAPGVTIKLTGVYTITQVDIDAGKVTNSALATGKDPKGKEVADISGTTVENNTPTVTLLPQEPKLTVTKTADRVEYSFIGDVINYTIKIQNSGTTTIHDIVVTDALTGLDTGVQNLTIPILLPGESQEFSLTNSSNTSYVITQNDLIVGKVTNVVGAKGIDSNDNNVIASATLVVEKATVLACGTVLVHNAFSPNGDAKNPVFVIDNIDDTTCYPENTVEIYNRWGVLVFETKNYNNTTNAFDGTSQGRSTVKQSDGLPAGTYFYIINYTSVDGNGNIQTNKKEGYLYLTR